MNFFGKPYNWAATIILIACIGMALFVVAVMIGMFVDASLPADLRGTIVITWSTLVGFIALGVMIGRHGS